MVPIELTDKRAVVFGVANKNSIAWSIARKLAEAGARLCLPFLGEKLGDRVRKLTADMPDVLLVDCDVTKDEQMQATFETIAKEFDGRIDLIVHSIAFARRQDLDGQFRDTTRDGYLLALEVSAYSLVRVMHYAAPLMPAGGSVIAMTYMASQRVVGNYNVMGAAKAALEHGVRQLAYELGPQGIRVNAISAGPVNTLSARGIDGFFKMLDENATRACLKRNITLDEVGNAALFLLSPLASGITAEILYVDAGYNVVQLG